MITLKLSFVRPSADRDTRPYEIQSTQVPRVGDQVFFDADGNDEYTVLRVSWDYGPDVEPGTVAYVVLS